MIRFEYIVIMLEIDSINDTFNYLYAHSEHPSTVDKIEAFLKYKGHTINTAPKTFCEILCKLEYVDKIENLNRTKFSGAQHASYDYQINMNGIHFADRIPFGEYKEKPYSYHLMIEDKKATEEENKNRYDFLQKRFIYKARWIPYIVSGIAIVISVFAYFKKNDTGRKEITPKTEGKPPETKQKNDTQPDSTGEIRKEKSAIDSPKKIKL